MIKKIIAIVLLVIGTLLILLTILSFLLPDRPGPESDDPAYRFGYYAAPFIFLIVGALLIFFGIRIIKKLNKEKLKKDLLGSLPK